MQQQQLLMDIREELRMTRTQSSAAAPGGGGPGTPRVGSTYLAAQATLDRMVSGQWASMGWTSAYAPHMQSGILHSTMGAMGIFRSPSTMTQPEYQAVSGEMLGQSMVGISLGMLAPSFARNSSAMGNALFMNSGRFARAGDAMSGIFGSGMDISSASHLARSLHVQAAGDLRQSGADYNTIMSNGLEAGQFDFSRSINDIKSKFLELASATADLTRVTRMSVDDVSKAMGAMRQFGVVDVADQSRLLRQMSAAGAVAGLNPGVMAQAAQAAMAMAMQTGTGAMGGMELSGTNAMAMRSMSRSGLMSAALVAHGGGTDALARALTTAQQQFAGSDLGNVLNLGGGGDFFGALSSGIAANGSVEGILRNQAGRIDRMSKLSGGRMAGLFDSRVDAGLSMMGLDADSEAGQGFIQSMLRNEMGDAGALAYARSRTGAGRASAFRDRYQAARMDERSNNMLLADRMYEADSITGSFHHLVAGVNSGAARMVNGVADVFSPGANGLFGIIEGSAARTRRLIGAGVMQDDMGSEVGWMDGIKAGDQFAGQKVRFANSNIGGAAGTILGGIAGAGLAVAAGANPIGLGLMAAGSVVAIAGGGTVGAMLGANAGGYFDARSRGMEVGGSDADTKRYLQSADAAVQAKSRTDGLDMLTRYEGSGAYQQLRDLARRTSGRTMSQTESLQFRDLSHAVVNERGGELSDVMTGIYAEGWDFKMHEVYSDTLMSEGDANESLDALTSGGTWHWALSDKGGSVLNTTAGKEALADYLGESGNAFTAQGRARLFAAGLSTGDLAQLDTNIKSGVGGDLKKLSGTLRNSVGTGRRQEFARRMSTTKSMLAAELEAGGDPAAAAALRGGDLIQYLGTDQISNEVQSETITMLNKIRSDSSDDELAKLTGLSAAGVARFRKGTSDGGKTNLGTLRYQMAQAMVSVQDANSEDKRAGAISNAANILKALADKMGVGT
jgi:hypothetical protein